jgi:polygalacturonase
MLKRVAWSQQVGAGRLGNDDHAHNILDFGAVGDGRTDNRRALQRAFSHARANGGRVYIPAGMFVRSGLLSINGIKVSGAGESAILKATQYGEEAIILRGDGVTFSNVRIEGFNGARLATDESVQVLVQSARDFAIENVHIVGSSSAGIKVNNSGYGYIANNLVENTRADSIHIVHSSHAILVERNRVLHSGDDGISVVSYRGGGIVRDVTIRDNKVLYNEWGRGISVLGGSDVLISRNHVDGGAADRAGIYIAAENEWDTEGVRNIRVVANTLVDGGGRFANHGAITIYNSQAAAGLAIDCVTITDNDIISPRRVGILVSGSGDINVAAYGNRVAGPNLGDLVNMGTNSTVITGARSSPQACEVR